MENRSPLPRCLHVGMRIAIVVAALALLVVFAPGTAHAQTPTPTPAPENYTIPAPSNRVTQLIQVVNMRNEKTCVRLWRRAGTNPWAVPWQCTQAQACVVAGATGGASCTAAQARAVDARIWVNTTEAGRTEFVTFFMVSPAFDDQYSAVPGWDQYIQCVTWNAASQATKDAMCTNAQRPVPCTLYPATCN